MTRWMRPPELDHRREPDRFDPATEGARRGLSREVSHALWERVCAEATDSTGQRDEERARQQFHELVMRTAVPGGRVLPDVGKVTRAGVGVDCHPTAWSVDERRSRVPGRETLVTAEIRPRMVVPSVPGRQTLVADAQIPRLGFDDYRVLGLKDLLGLLGPRHALRQDLVAAAANTDRSLAGRAMPWLEQLPSVTAPTPNGHALWQVAERHSTTLYRRAVSSGLVDPPDPAVESALQQRGASELLPLELRRVMERELGVELSGVRIHTDALAARAARALAAAAFTVGEDIFFAEGMFSPDTRSGRTLLAHELTHVAQALRGRTGLVGDGLRVSQPSEPLEQEADETAARVDAMAALEMPAPSAPSVSQTSDRSTRTGIDPARAAMTEESVAMLAPRLGLDAGSVDIRCDVNAGRRVAGAGASGLMEAGIVYLGPDRYDPTTKRGRYLLAHELAHVAQSRLAPDVNQPSGRDAAEAEAAHIGLAWADGQSFAAPRVSLSVGAAADTGAEQMAKARPEVQSDFVLHVGNDNFVVSFELLPGAGGGDVRVVISPTDFSRAYQSLMKYWDVRGREVNKDDSWTSMGNVGTAATPWVQHVTIADRTKFDPVLLQELPEKAATVWTFDWNGDTKPEFGIRCDFSISNTLREYNFTARSTGNTYKFDFWFIQDDAWKYGYQGANTPRREKDDFIDFLGGILTSKTTWEMAITMIPVIGEVVLLGEALSGYTIFGDKMSTAERVVSGLAAVLPVVGGVLAKGVTKAGANLAKLAAQIGRSEEEVWRCSAPPRSRVWRLPRWRSGARPSRREASSPLMRWPSSSVWFGNSRPTSASSARPNRRWGLAGSCAKAVRSNRLVRSRSSACARRWGGQESVRPVITSGKRPRPISMLSAPLAPTRHPSMRGCPVTATTSWPWMPGDAR